MLALLEEPRFWRTYLRWELPAPVLDEVFGPEDEALRQRLFPPLVVPAAFDDDDRAATRALLGAFAHLSLDEGPGRSALEQTAARRRLPPNPELGLTLPGGYQWVIAFDPTPGIYHSLTHAEGTLALGQRDPHFELPILRWTEIESLAAHLPERARPLLHAVAWLDPDENVEAVAALVGRHWRQSGIVSDAAIARLVAASCEPTAVRWRPDERGWINDGEHSRRNPDNDEWDEAAFAVWRRFLIDIIERGA